MRAVCRISVVLTGANVHDKWPVADVLDAVIVRNSRGPRRPKNLCLDKGYDYADPEAEIISRRITPHIRRRGDGIHGARGWTYTEARSWHVRASRPEVTSCITCRRSTR